MKIEWGCEKRTEIPVVTMECVRCNGEGCERCDGGQIDIHDCPVKLLRRTPQVWQTVEAYRWMNAHGILPVDGGLLSQTSAFLRAVGRIEIEVRKIQRDRERCRASPPSPLS